MAVYTKRVEIRFVYDGTNAQEIVDNAHPLTFKVGDKGELLRQSAGWVPVTEGTVIDQNMSIVSPSMEQFLKDHIEVPQALLDAMQDMIKEELERQLTAYFDAKTLN